MYFTGSNLQFNGPLVTAGSNMLNVTGTSVGHPPPPRPPHTAKPLDSATTACVPPVPWCRACRRVGAARKP